MVAVLALAAYAAIGDSAESDPGTRVPWKDCLRQPPAWYGSTAARRMADNVLLYQLDSGAWAKNIDMTKPLTDTAAVVAQKKQTEDSTIDNGATYTQLTFLARVHRASGEARFQDAFLRGLDFLLAAQYANGGWPQFPFGRGYHRHVTFNDDAMVGVLTLLRDIARTNASFAFVDAPRRARAAQAVQRGIRCMLQCQVMVDGQRTVWCAQHDAVSLAPAPARSYELVSLSGSESVGIVRFLMGEEHPSPEIIASIQPAVKWFERAKLTGIRQVPQADPSQPNGRDKVIVADPAAPPLWARFYEIGSNRPFFCGRDGVKRYRLAEIEHERRTGYAWYTEAPAALLATDYPAWRKRWAPRANVLGP